MPVPGIHLNSPQLPFGHALRSYREGALNITDLETIDI